MHRRYKPILNTISWLLVFTTSVSSIRWDVSDFNVTILNPQKAEAQAVTPTTFYFKDDSRPATAHFGVMGPTAENSTDSDDVGGSPAGKAVAYTMVPVAGPLLPTTTSDSVVTTEAVRSTNLYIWVRTFIMPLASGTQFTSSTTFTVGMSFDESATQANSYARAFAYVYDSNDDANAKTLAGPTNHATEIGTRDEGRVWSLANAVGLSPYTTDEYDFLAVEIWLNTSSNNLTAYDTITRWGGNVPVVDGTTNTDPASYFTIGTTTVDTFDPIYFLPTTAPPEPTPNDAQTGDSFRGGTSDIRRMSTVPGAGAETNTQAVDTTAGNWKMNIFVSPPLAAQTIPEGNWMIHLHGDQANGTAFAQFRGMIYTWDADDTIGDTIISVQSSGTTWGTATTNNQLDVVWAGSATTITAGERLVAEWNVVTVINPLGAYDVNDRFGSGTTPSTTTYDSCILPPMDYASNPVPISWLGATYEQTHFWFDEDNDDETHTAWTDKDGATTEDDATVTFNNGGSSFRLRIQIRNIGAESDTLTPKLEYRINDPPGSWVEITTGSAAIKIVASDQFTDGTATTRQLTNQTGYDFTAGDMEEDSSPSGNTTMARWNFTEYEWSLQGATPGTYDIRANDNGVAFNTYTNTPVVTFPGYSPKMNNWRWYGDEDDTAVDTPYAVENTVPPQEEMGKSIPIKLRINLTETSGSGEDDSRKILQYSTSTEGPWTGVAAIGTISLGTIWRFYNGGGTDGATLPSKVLSDSSAVSLGTHNEADTSGQTYSDHPASTTVEWEFCFENYDAVANTTYYFNIQDEVLGTDIPLGDGKSYPSLTTASAYDLSVVSRATIELGNYQLGGGAYHEYNFTAGEVVTIRDNRGQIGTDSSGWSLTADVTTELVACTGTLGDIVFTGTGLDDMSHNNTYTGCSEETFTIIVTNILATPDQFTWSSNLGPTGAGVDMSTDWITLANGAQVKWNAVDGHTLNDNWQFTSVPGSPTTIAKASTYWISDSITGLFAAPTTNISTQPGSYMSSAVTASSVVGNAKDGLGAFTIQPTMRLYNLASVGSYTGQLTFTII